MKKYLNLVLINSFLLTGFFNNAQELNALVLDSLSQNPIPFAIIYLKSGSGGVSNEEGRFRLQYEPTNTVDSLFISCMGYKTLAIPALQLKDSVFYLAPKSIELNSIILMLNGVTANFLAKGEAIILPFEITRNRIVF